MPFRDVTAADVENGWRPLTSDEFTVAMTLCSRAMALLRAHDPDVDARVDSGRLHEDVVVSVVVEMVIRVLANPQRLDSETTGPFTPRWNVDNASGRLQVTAGDLAQLRPGTPGGRIGTIRVAPRLL